MARSLEIRKKEAKDAYCYCKKVYKEKDKSKKAAIKKDAIKKLKECGVNESSANNYLNNFPKMIEGNRYGRCMNDIATEYFLEKIKSDYKLEGLIKAVEALEKWINYYQDELKKSARSKVKILKKYKEIIADEREHNSKI